MCLLWAICFELILGHYITFAKNIFSGHYIGIATIWTSSYRIPKCAQCNTIVLPVARYAMNVYMIFRTFYWHIISEPFVSELWRAGCCKEELKVALFNLCTMPTGGLVIVWKFEYIWYMNYSDGQIEKGFRYIVFLCYIFYDNWCLRMSMVFDILLCAEEQVTVNNIWFWFKS